MTPAELLGFREVWAVDFEFSAPPGERPIPLCLAARELRTGRVHRLWRDELLGLKAPPYPTDGDCLFVAYYASAELGCHLALGWQLPVNVLDLFVEFKNMTNGIALVAGCGLLGALTFFGVDGIAAAEKKRLQERANAGGSFTEDERRELLDYCMSDVDALAALLPHIAPRLDLPRALVRGRFMAAAARIEHQGVPIDVPALATVRARWDSIKDRLIEKIDVDYGVFEARTFRAKLFAGWLAEHDLAWPQLPSGALALDADTFREMARSHPEVAPLQELRASLSQLKLNDLAVGQDGRNRVLLSAFSARTGRNAPSNARFVFGPAVWIRGLIRPEPGHGIAYVDWSQQEFGIAAALSGDGRMIEAYASGDPYLAFARQAAAVPADATKRTHASVRELYKQCVLGVQYGMEADSLARRIDRPVATARDLLRRHHETYPSFWRWSDAAVDVAMLRGKLSTVFGWTIHTAAEANPRSLRNFPMQANGAEMLRLACIDATERGVRVCAPVHDALLIEAPLDELDDAVATTQKSMSDASAMVLAGFRLRSDARLIRYPERYMDDRGRRMWATVTELVSAAPTCAPMQQDL